MIFRQIPQIVDGTKTQTRRIVKPNEVLRGGCVKTVMDDGSERVKWCVGQNYAVQPGRGQRGVYYDTETGTVYGHGYEPRNTCGSPFVRPLRYTILSLHREPLQSISIYNALCEGILPTYEPVADYEELWDSINGRGAWDANPNVWVIKFEVNDEL